MGAILALYAAHFCFLRLSSYSIPITHQPIHLHHTLQSVYHPPTIPLQSPSSPFQPSNILLPFHFNPYHFLTIPLQSYYSTSIHIIPLSSFRCLPTIYFQCLSSPYYPSTILLLLHFYSIIVYPVGSIFNSFISQGFSPHCGSVRMSYLCQNFCNNVLLTATLGQYL